MRASAVRCCCPPESWAGYQLWRTNDEAGAMRWVLVDIVISAVVLLAVNLLEKKQKAGGRA